MSVPLPSPSLSSPPPRNIPGRSRPEKLDLEGHAHGPASPSPSNSFRRPTAAASKSSGGPRSSPPGNGAPNGGEDNWRERAGTRKGPERTVGGFDKPSSAGSGSVRSPVGAPGPQDVGGNGNGAKDGQPMGEAKAEALSHVPCRFYRAGTCTAGSSCPFSHEEGGTKEICQWFLKGNCKFGHKCALLHIRPGDPLSMDRKNKKSAQREARERAEGKPPAVDVPFPSGPTASSEHGAVPVPIKSALATAIQSPPGRLPSSPLREPFGPPSGTQAGSPGFGSRSLSAFASSPSRPSGLSTSIGPKPPTALQLRPSSALHSPLRPPVTAGPAGFSNSFSHSALTPGDRPAPLSASFADTATARRNIWAPSPSDNGPGHADDLISPARRAIPPPRAVPRHMRRLNGDGDDEEHGEDLLPSSLEDLMTPSELARRKTRRDSHGSFGASSPSFQPFFSAERLAQSAGATMDPGFLRSLWSDTGADARRTPISPGAISPEHRAVGFNFGPATAQPSQRQSLLTQQRNPTSPQRFIRDPTSPHAERMEGPYLRHPPLPSSPSAKALQEHAPGQSLPGGLAGALSRLHMTSPIGQPANNAPYPAGREFNGDDELTPPGNTVPLPSSGTGTTRGKEDQEEGLFTMDG